MSHAREVETRTQLYGREIFARVDAAGPLPFSPDWWDDRLMGIGMGDPAVKVQLFRFVDVLPMLRSPAEITRHLREYFAEAEGKLPGWVSLGLRLLPSSGMLGGVLAWAADFSARRLARKFIAGSNIPEVLEAVADLRRRSLAFTVDLLGEATMTDAEADASQAEYLELIDGLGEQINAWPEIEAIDRNETGTLPRVNVSVKFSSLDAQFDPIDPRGTSAAVRERLRPIFRAARTRHAFVNVDMEQYAYKDLTLQILREVLEEPEFRDWPDVGLAFQAYLRDSEADLQSLGEWAERRGTPVTVRLVKGAYWDYETIHAEQNNWPSPVWRHKPETDASYERLTRLLLEKRQWLRPAFASHNVRSLAHALALADLLGVPPRGLEIQMLYGMGDPIKDVLRRMGRRVRVYTPYGDLLPGMAYLVRRLLENTANESFLRAGFVEQVPPERLLRDPATQLPSQEVSLMTIVEQPASPTATPFHIEPLSDFARADAREAMQSAIRTVAGKLGAAVQPIVDGQSLDTANRIERVNPSHRKQVVGVIGLASAEQATLAIELAARAFPSWRETPVEQRSELLLRAAGVMRQRRFELAAWMVHECGKPWREADGDVAEAIDFCDYYAREMLQLAQPRHRDVAGEANRYFYEPRGVTVVLAPWNFPLAILCGMTAAALVAGNPVIMKPAEQSSTVGLRLMEIFQEAGVPAGVLHFLPGEGEIVGPVLVKHPEVALIAFTGSRQVGLLINRQAAETVPGQRLVKRVIAEMGGKNAVILDDDADLDEAIHGVVWSAFGYAGQKCSACSRVLVPEHLHNDFLERLIEATRSLRVAPAEDPACSLGPVIDAEAHGRIGEAIKRGQAESRLAFAGDLGAFADEGYYHAPHIFADVAPDAWIAQEEIFGPVLAVLRYRDLTHALTIANGTPYALTGGLYSRSPANIARVQREFRVGNLYINRKITGALVDRQPFGGFKLSGIGSKAGGPDYLLQFVVPRTITENTMRRGFAPPASP